MRPTRSTATAHTIRELTIKAIDKLNAMRQREGEALFNDLMKHVNVIATSLAEISEARPVRDRGLSQAACRSGSTSC